MSADDMTTEEHRIRELEATDKRLNARIDQLEKLIRRLATTVGATRQMTEAP